MNVDMRNLFTKAINQLDTSHKRLSENIEDEQESWSIDAIVEDIEDAKDKIEWMSDSLQEFLMELKDRKTEGEAVIDEIIKVLCIRSK